MKSFVRHLKESKYARFFPIMLGVHYFPDEDAVLLSNQGEVLTRADWLELKAEVDRFYERATDEMIEAITRESAEAQAQRSAQLLQKPKKLNGYIYVLQSEQGLYKIGRTQNINSRLSSISTSSPYNVKLITSLQVEDQVKAEAYLHTKFADKRKRREWFDLSSEDIEYLRNLTDGFYE